MPDEQDRAEALDVDKGAFPDDDVDQGVDLIDQTADADPGQAERGREELDAGESGDDLQGVLADPDTSPDPFHTEEPAPEVAAVHVVEEEGS